MRNIARQQIKQLFNNPQKIMANGLWFSGYKEEGEYKRWWSNGRLFQHCFYKDGKIDGEYKVWYDNGKLQTHCFFKNDKYDGEFKQWRKNGLLYAHYFYKNDEVIKDYLE